MNLSSSLVPIFTDSQLKSVHSGFFVSTETTPGKLSSSSSGAYGVIGEACRILRRDAKEVRYDLLCTKTLPLLIGIRYGSRGLSFSHQSITPIFHYSILFITPPFPTCRRRLPSLSFATGPTGCLRCRGSETQRRGGSMGAERSAARCLALPWSPAYCRPKNRCD